MAVSIEKPKVIVAVVTLPTVEETIDHICTVLKNGADGVVVAGTTGGGPGMEFRRKQSLMGAVGRARLSGRIPDGKLLFMGTGTRMLSEALEIVIMAPCNGFSGVLVAPPLTDPDLYYNMVIGFATRIGAPGMVVLYHYPGIEYHISTDLFAKLVEKGEPEVWLKDSSGDEVSLRGWGNGKRVIVGFDPKVVKALSCGWASWIISGTANTREALEALCNIRDTFAAGDYKRMWFEQARLDEEVERMLAKGPSKFIEMVTENRIR